MRQPSFTLVQLRYFAAAAEHGSMTAACSCCCAIMHVTVLEGEHAQLKRGLRDGSCELSLMYAFDLDEDIDRVLVDSARPYALVSTDHPLARRKRVSLAELAPEPMVLLDLPHSDAYFESMVASTGVVPNVRFRTTGYETVRAMVANGHGYALLNQRPVHETTYDGRSVVSLKLRDQLAPLEIVLAWMQGVRLTRRARSSSCSRATCTPGASPPADRPRRQCAAPVNPCAGHHRQRSNRCRQVINRTDALGHLFMLSRWTVARHSRSNDPAQSSGAAEGRHGDEPRDRSRLHPVHAPRRAAHHRPHSAGRTSRQGPGPVHHRGHRRGGRRLRVVDRRAEVRLLQALEAGLRAGGEAGPVHSAGLSVVRQVPWRETDLRVDWSEEPVAELRWLVELWLPQRDAYVTRALDPSAAPSYGVPGDE